MAVDNAPFLDHTILIPGPTFHVDLSGLDARHPVHYSRRLLFFRCASPAQRDAQLAALKTGLQALVAHCPILGGIVVPLPPDEAGEGQDDWRTIVPDRGAELVVRDLRKAMPSFEELEVAEFSASDLPSSLLMPIPSDIGNDRPFSALKVQFSAIEGGTIITFAMSHSVADGVGTDELLRILSEETRLAQVHSSQGVTAPLASLDYIGLDRGAVRHMSSEIEFKIEEHPAYRWNTPPPIAASSSEQKTKHPFEATAPEIPVSLHISPAALARLKADASLPNAPFISTHDALVALLWRSVLLLRSRRSALAKDLPASTVGTLFMPSDARRHLNLPPSYIGNVVYQLTADLDLATLLSDSGLPYAAGAIRSAITAVKPGLVASCLAKTNEKWIDWQFLTTMLTTGVAMGTDWGSGALYSADWGEGFGRLVSYRYPGGPGDAMNCVMPKLLDGGAELIVAVMPDEVEALKGTECFGKYIER